MSAQFITNVRAVMEKRKIDIHEVARRIIARLDRARAKEAADNGDSKLLYEITCKKADSDERVQETVDRISLYFGRSSNPPPDVQQDICNALRFDRSLMMYGHHALITMYETELNRRMRALVGNVQIYMRTFRILTVRWLIEDHPELKKHKDAKQGRILGKAMNNYALHMNAVCRGDASASLFDLLVLVESMNTRVPCLTIEDLINTDHAEFGDLVRAHR